MIFCRTFKAMNSYCEIRMNCASEQDADRGLTLVTTEVERIEAKYSSYRSNSHWQQLVVDAGSGSGVSVDDETARLLDMAELGHTVSEGLCDVTLSALLDIWDWQAASLPNTRTIAEAMRKSGWSLVNWQRPVLVLPDVGMRIDLGSLIKEYTADTCIKLLQEHGFASAMVQLGRDVAACLEDDSEPPWKVEIKQSYANRNRTVLVLVRNGGLATRGDFDRCMVVNGIRYSHLLDPRTGWPVQGLASVSVLAPQCATAGMLATTAMVRGEGRGPAWLEQMEVDFLCTNSAGQRSGPLHIPAQNASGVA
jgi:thiamine biosynthesis lipoprotein